MSDQCAGCTVKGDLDRCHDTPCSNHESWYATHLKLNLSTIHFVLSLILQDHQEGEGIVIKSEHVEMVEEARKLAKKDW